MHPLPHPAIGKIIAAAKTLSVKRVLLFGSRARGDHQERADIDIAIDAPDLDDADFRKIWWAAEEADTLLKIDCVHLQRVADNFRDNILKDAKVLYER